MKITIESTDMTTDVHGVPCRIWRGVTERGVACDLAIPLIRVPIGADSSQFEQEIKILPDWGQTRTVDMRHIW